MGVKHLEDAGLQEVLIKKTILRTSWRERENKGQVKIPSSTNFNPSPKDMLGIVSPKEKTSKIQPPSRNPMEAMRAYELGSGLV